MAEKAIVIGAGLGGLAVSAQLAAEGYQVDVYEKNSSPGGKMQQCRIGGYRFDTGPSLLTMPFILENLFTRCGREISQYLKWSEPSPLCRYVYHDGTVFDNFSDRKKTEREIMSFAPEDAGAYSDFLDHSEKLYNRTSDAFLFNPLYDMSDLRSLSPTDFLKIDAFSTVSERVDKAFQSRYLRQFFKRFTTYNGSSPFKAPATLNVIPHVELNQGGYYVHGGMYGIAEALHQLASEMGAVFHFNTVVEQIEVRNASVTGVHLDDGRKVDSCDLLIANSDATDTILNLLPDGAVSNRKKRKHRSIEPSCSGFVLMLGCSRRWEQLKHHNIFFSKNYRREFDDIFEKRTMPSDPTIYIANTSHTDPRDAPDGGSNLFVLVNAPYTDPSQDWDTIEPSYSSFVIDRMEERGLGHLRQSIDSMRTITPPEFEKRYGSNRGSIYGTSSNNRFSAFVRPRNKLRELQNLYLVGGSTHPGGGIPLVLQSASNVMELLGRR